MEAPEIERIAKKIRLQILKMVAEAGSGHIGPSFSAVEILATLIFGHMSLRPDESTWPDRDRLILSKGHAAPAYYAALALRGLFSAERLSTLRQLGSELQGYPDTTRLPGVDATTGALGHGLSIGLGMALGLRLSQSPARVYVLLGDGELNEGQIWEAAMAASHYQVNQLRAIVDRNRMQLDGAELEVMKLEPLVDKWRAFGWQVEIVDGYRPEAMLATLRNLNSDGPTVILANTVKGYGVSFMEHNPHFHYGLPTPDELTRAVTELIRGPHKEVNYGG